MPAQVTRISAQRLLLLAIGKVFQAEYAAAEEPLPGRLAALLKQLERLPPARAEQSHPSQRRAMASRSR
jgi:hypothetical protein